MQNTVTETNILRIA